MKNYSQARLLEQELSMIPGAKDFLGKLVYKMHKSSTVLLVVEVPVNLYLRTEVFCEDIQDLSEVAFEQNDLINLLYNDFLLFAKKNPDPRTLFKMLTSIDDVSAKERTFINEDNSSVFKAIYTENRDVPMQELHIRMRRKAALRGEVLLADMEEVYPNHGYTLEKVFELLYRDFIDKFRKGDNTEAVKAILSLLSDDE